MTSSDPRSRISSESSGGYVKLEEKIAGILGAKSLVECSDIDRAHVAIAVGVDRASIPRMTHEDLIETINRHRDWVYKRFLHAQKNLFNQILGHPARPIEDLSDVELRALIRATKAERSSISTMEP